MSFYGEGLQLSREQRSRILAGHYDPLRFDSKPECQEGDRYVLTWSKARQLDDGQGNKRIVPREPSEVQGRLDDAIKHGQRTRRTTLAGQITLMEEWHGE